MSERPSNPEFQDQKDKQRETEASLPETERKRRRETPLTIWDALASRPGPVGPPPGSGGGDLPPIKDPNTSLEPEVDTHGATFIGADKDPPDIIPIEGDSAAPAPIGQPSASPRWLVPALVAAVLLLGVIGFAVTRSSGQPNAAPVPVVTLPPAPTAGTPTQATAVPTASSAARVTQLTFATPADGTSVCLQPVNFTLKVTLENARAGDTVHVALNGPGMPAAGVTGSVDSSLTFATSVGPVGPVKGRNVWEATVDTINGQPTASIRATALAICP